MELSVKERLTLLSILPHEGDILTIKIVRQLREALSLSEEEHEQWNVQLFPETGRIEWDEEKAVVIDIPFGPQAMKVCVDTLLKLNQEKKLLELHIPLYDKFIGTTE